MKPTYLKPASAIASNATGYGSSFHGPGKQPICQPGLPASSAPSSNGVRKAAPTPAARSPERIDRRDGGVCAGMKPPLSRAGADAQATHREGQASAITNDPPGDSATPLLHHS